MESWQSREFRDNCSRNNRLALSVLTAVDIKVLELHKCQVTAAHSIQRP